MKQTRNRALDCLNILNHWLQVPLCINSLFGKVAWYTKSHIYASLNLVTHKLFHQERQSAARTQTEKSVFSAENTVFTCVCWSRNDESWSEAQCVAEANVAAHWDFGNKANANRPALIFIYDYTVIYVCVNGGGHQLFSMWCGLCNW